MLTLEDRFAVQDLLAEYVRAMDHAEVEAVVRLFTADGWVRDIQNRMWDADAGGPRGFAERWLQPPLKKRGQHWIQHVRFETPSTDEVQVYSYWQGLRWNPAETEAPVLGVIGTYRDVCVRQGGRWLIRSKTIDRWVSEA